MYETAVSSHEAVVIGAVFAILAAITAQLASREATLADPPDRVLDPSEAFDFGQSTFAAQGERQRARYRRDALQAVATAFLVVTALVAAHAALASRLTLVVASVGVACGIVFPIAIAISWLQRDRYTKAGNAYGVFYLRYKVLGVDGTRKAFERAEPRLARRLFKK